MKNKPWRSLEERARPESVRERAEREFAPGASEWSGASRREFLELAGATLALAGAAGCTRQPPERIVPYVSPPETIVPGKPLHYATALSERAFGAGVLVESHMGRPTKIEGNPDHPASLGATDVWMQAAILELYDPERSQVVRGSGRIATYEELLRELSRVAAAERARGGRGLRILTGRISSPTVLSLLESLLGELPEAHWHAFEPVDRENVREGTRLAFGRELTPFHDVGAADVILSLDADFLYSEPGHLRYTRELADRRDPDGPLGMSRLYVVEPSPSVTGTMADHRLALPASRIASFARSLARRLGVGVAEGAAADGFGDWMDVVAADLAESPGRSLVVAGESQSPEVHALAYAMNDALESSGRTTRMLAAPESPEPGTLEELAEALAEGGVELLVMIGVNPVYTAPADLDFAALLERATLSLHMGLYADETAARSDWHLPQAHELESWGDVRAFEGTVTIQQPLIEPLYRGTTPAELIAAIAAVEPPPSAYDLVRQYWRGRWNGAEAEFEGFFRRALHDGVVEGTRFAEVGANADVAAIGTEAPEDEGLEILFRPDATIRDGRFANNAWLQELPKPLTKLTWDNAALLGVGTAARLGVGNEDVVTIRYRDRALDAPVWIVPGQAEETLVLPLGYGRELAQGFGFDAYRLRTSEHPWNGFGAELEPTGGRYPLAATQQHFEMEGRPLARHGTLEEYRHDPDFVHEDEHAPSEEESLYPSWDYDRYAWGMAINLNTCIGCGACVVACQAENNIPVVGKEGVLREREMHWIRVDRYFEGTAENPRFYHQPVPCMHCENAPCEPVCPVAATVHSDEGLNEMVYNRCVGTRYCSNNCPYKVRRFNFLDYTPDDVPVLKLLRNPDVTVRSRGVMEKCTYCVQRISAARIEAKKEDRSIRDGEIETACQAACPAEAIVFGDVNDPDTLVSRLKRNPRNYAMLSELNTRPRTTYLAKLWNFHPELEGNG